MRGSHESMVLKKFCNPFSFGKSHCKIYKMKNVLNAKHDIFVLCPLAFKAFFFL